MANLTLTIDDELLRRARIRALQRGTSVNAVVRAYLSAYAGDDLAREGVRNFLEIARRAESSSGPDGREWSREALHER
jgi:plasmid stability protein